MKNKKKAPKKYAQGGNIQQIKDAQTIDAIAPVKKGKKLKDSTFKEEGSDYLRLLGKTAATPLGLNNAPVFQEDKFNTKLGKQGAGVTDKYVAPVTRAAVGAGLSIIGTPAAGAAYLGATSAVDQSQQKKYNNQNAQTEGESDLAYQNRMAAKGIDINDTKVGLQGTEGLMAAGLSAGYGMATDPKTAKNVEGIKGLYKKKKATSSDLAVQQQELDAEIAADPQGDIRTTQRQGFKHGGVLKGKTHKEGGIKGKVGKTPIEMENNEIVLTKGVYEDPELREAASRINQMAGGNPIKGTGKGLSRLGEGGTAKAKKTGINTKPHESTLDEDEQQAEDLKKATAESDLIKEGMAEALKKYTPSTVARTREEEALNQSALKYKEAQAKNKAEQIPNIDKQTFGLETGLGLFQAGYGLQQLRKDGKRPEYQVPSELTNSLARANEDAKFGFDNATGEAYQRGIEGARIQNVALASQLGGGNAAEVQNNARASTNQLGQGMLNFYSKDAQLQLQKKQYSDQLGKAVASEKDRGFQYKMDAFNQNQRAGADLLGAGISNIFTMRKNQRELDAQKSFAQNNNFDKNNYNKWAAANNQPLIP